jgi:hypothetical protein
VPATTTTINRKHRDGLYELVRNHLGSVSDLFSEDLRLIQDFGWARMRGARGSE